MFFDLHTRISGYNQDDIDKAVWGRKKIVTFDEWDRGGMSCDDWPYPLTNQQAEVFLHTNSGQVDGVHFCRKMDKTKQYPPNIFPYEKCIMNDFPLTTPDELFSRRYDFCWIGNESPTRKNVVNGLLNAGLKGYVHWTNERGKIPHNEWLDLHRQAKFFLESDGGGFCSERPMQLLTIAPMLRQKNNMLRINDWEDVTECVDISESVSHDDEEMIKYFLKNKGSLYSTYVQGAEKLRAFYTEEYRANYILDVLKKNNVI